MPNLWSTLQDLVANVFKALIKSRHAHPKLEYLSDVEKYSTGVLFFGTPHRGSDLAPYGRFFEHLARLLMFDTNAQIIRTLSRNTEELENLRTEFSKMVERDDFRVKSFYETKSYVTFRQFFLPQRVRIRQSCISVADYRKVVDEKSATLGDKRDAPHGISANHMNMCKFKSREDDGYKAVAAEMKYRLNPFRESDVDIEKELKEAASGWYRCS